ncbi:hypothetical protein C0995_005332 [Termitomyces sp. Mi166|nr:hypothetical protein C0995_005332 [Termitomyces sp. Mi166\
MVFDFLRPIDDISVDDASHRKCKYIPTIAQFLVLGIRNVSHSISQPQYTVNEASQILYIEYELPFPPSPPRFNVLAKSGLGIGNIGVVLRSNLASNVHAQQALLTQYMRKQPVTASMEQVSFTTTEGTLHITRNRENRPEDEAKISTVHWHQSPRFAQSLEKRYLSKGASSMLRCRCPSVHST